MRACCFVFALFLFSCGEPRTKIDKPTAPDMSEVVSGYEHPHGVLDPTTAKNTLDTYAERAAIALSVGVQELVIPWLQTALDEVNEHENAPETYAAGEPGVSRQFLVDDANGTIKVERICNGWGPEPVPDRANGLLTLRVNFSETGLDPVLWGEARDCQYVVAGISQVSIDQGSGRTGAVRLWVGRSATFGNFGSDPIIFDLDLSTEISGLGTAVALDFRVAPSGELAFAIDAGPGKVVVSPGKSVGKLSVVAENGTFECDVTGSECTSELGQTFSF